MFTKRQVLLGGIALVLVTFFLTAAVFMSFFHLVSGDAVSTVKFFSALRVVQARFIKDEPVDKLINGAIKGMVRSLDDPHSMYMDGEFFRQFVVETQGQFGGIGVVVGVKDNMITVVAPIEGTPGEAAGIKSGDKIIKIDGESTSDMPLGVAVGKIRGPKDTFVEIVFLRADGEEKTIKIMRTNIKLRSVKGEKLEDGMGYIRIRTFSENTYEEFTEEINKLDAQNVKGIVLDLRGNPGGLLESSVKVAEYFVPEGPVVSVVGRTGEPEIYYSGNKKPKYKVTVLVNEGSASASEIVAGAIQDTKAGMIIGKTSYGKGSVQAIMSLDSESAIKLTSANYYTPSGKVIDGVGVTPDIEVENSEYTDLQLEKAKEVLRETLAGKE